MKSHLPLMMVFAALAACGGSGNNGSPDGSTPPPDSGQPDAGAPDAGSPDAGMNDGGPSDGGSNHAPTAAFSASATAQAGAPVAFDGTASSDPDGDALSYSWDFGDGEHGGTSALSHAFAAAGAYSVKLTVADGRGGMNSVSHAISISPLTQGTAIQVTGEIVDANGPLSGVMVQDVNGAAYSTNGGGKVALFLSTGVPHTLKLSKPGYADQFQPMNIDADATAAVFRTAMIAREAAQALDSAAGGTLSGKDGAKITLAAGSLVNSAGAAVTGMVQISQTPVDVSGAAQGAFPGTFLGVESAGAQGPIVSYGTTEFSLTQNGQKIQLAPGSTAAIELPIYVTQHATGADIQPGDPIPLWSLSETTGLWVREGTGIVAASSSSPTGLALQAQVGHFSWWNGDSTFTGPYDPKPRCYLNPGPEFTPIPIPCTIGPPLPGEFQLNPPPRSRQVSTFPFAGWRVEIPLAGGVTVPVPSGMDFTFHACAIRDNLFYCGTLKVNGADGASDEPHILLDPIAPAGTCGAPTELTLPADQSFSIATTAEASCLSFTAVQGQVLMLTLSQSGSSLAGEIQLTGPDGQTIDTAAFNSQSLLFTEVLPESGDYQIKIGADTGAPGAFSLSATLDTPQAIAVPSTAVYTVDPASLVKRFTFDADAGDVIALTVRSSGPNGGSPGLVKSLQDGSASSFQPGRYGELTFQPTAAGSYGFEVDITQIQTGTDVLVSLSKARTISIGDTVTDAVVPSDGSVASFAFQGTAGMVIAAANDSEATNTGTELCPAVIQIFDPAGHGIGTGYDLFIAPTALTASGTYRLDLFMQAANYGSCPQQTFQLAQVQPPAAVTLTPPSTATSGTLDGLAEHRYYTVHLTAGDVVRLVLHSDDPLACTMELLPPDDTLPFFGRRSVDSITTESNQGSNVAINYTNAADYPAWLVPATGDYVVHIFHAGARIANATGSFRWTLLDPTPVPIALDTLVHGSMTVPAQLDRYSFTLASPQVLIPFSRRTDSNAPPFGFAMLVRDSTGAVFQATTASAGVNLPAGSYTVDVFYDAGYCGSASDCGFDFAYDAILATIEQPVPISPGQTKSGTIDVIAERDYFQFDVVAGQTYTISSTAPDGLEASILAYQQYPSGDFTVDEDIFNGTAAGGIGGSFTFTANISTTGFIEVLPQGTNHTSTGSYTITLQ